MDARVGDVEPGADEPRRPLDPARVVEHGVPVAGERNAEVGDDGAPEPVGLVDRHAVELFVAGATESACEPTDVRRGKLLPRWPPGEVGRLLVSSL